MSDRHLPVDECVLAISGLHRGESPQPGGAVVESLRRVWPALKVIGLCYDPMESGIYSTGLDRLDAARLMPYPGAGPEPLLRRLVQFIEQEGINVIIPCLDSELANYLEIEEELARLGVRMLLPKRASLDAMAKTQLPELCSSIDVPTPRVVHANDAATLAARVLEIGYPCYVKGRLYDARAVGSAAELYAAFADIHRVWGGPVLAQEAVFGEEYDLTGLGDGKGGLVAFCAIRKMLRTKLGKGYAGVVVDNPELEDFARRIIHELKWNGPFELEFIKASGRPPMLMEMNPRFPAWIDFPAKIDCNLPAAFVERLCGGRSVALQRCPAGKMFIRHCTDLVGDIAEIARLTGEQSAAPARASEPA
jgi:carbamoyl-phosphate synthase large subunit